MTTLKPFLIITNGTTGSGKTSLVDKTMKYYGLSGEYTKLLIDDVVQNHAAYKERVAKFVEKYCSGKLEYCEALKNVLSAPSKSVYDEFWDMYSSVRGNAPSKPEECPGKNGEHITCDRFLEDLIDESIRTEKNLVFETTGTYYVEWLLAKTEKYRVYYAFTVLDFCVNKTRIKNRFRDQMQDFIRTKGESQAPRLADVNQKLVANVRQLNQLLHHLLLQAPQKDHFVVVFDNNSTGSDQPLYDSNRNKSLTRTFWLHLNKVQGLRTELNGAVSTPDCEGRNREELESKPYAQLQKEARSLGVKYLKVTKQRLVDAMLQLL